MWIDRFRTFVSLVRFSFRMVNVKSGATMPGLPEQLSDEELMNRYAKYGDIQAFENLLGRYRRQIFGFLIRSVRNRDTAEDLYQEVFLRVIRAADHYHSSASFRTWIFTIVRNIVRDHYRRSQVRACVTHEADHPDEDRVFLCDVPDDCASDPLKQASMEEMRQVIAKALQMLPEEQREMFLLREEAGLDFDQAARAANCSVNTAKSRMRYALLKLRDTLSRAGYEDAEVA